MGYTETAETAELPLWQRYREAFPVTKNLIYLNHAGVAPLCKPAADAICSLASDVLHYGSNHYDTWLAAYEGLRSAAGRLIGASNSEIRSSRTWKDRDIGVWRSNGKPRQGRSIQRNSRQTTSPEALEARGVHVECLSVFEFADR